MPDFQINPRYSSLEDLMSHFDKGIRLDLGCGYYKPDGYIGIDNGAGFAVQVANEATGPDIIMDLNSGALPFSDSSCIEVRASHFLEHSIVDHVISEAHRVLKPGGILRIIVPYANSAEGMYPGHTLFFTEKWFKNNLNFCKCFVIVKERYLKSDYYKYRMPLLIRLAMPFRISRLFLFNACSEMHLECKARK